MKPEDTRPERILAGGCVLVSGYLLLIIALLADSYVFLALGAVTFLLGFASFQKFDSAVRRSCATSGFVHLLWLGFIAACVVWDATLTVKVLALLLSPTGWTLVALAMGTGDGLRRLATGFRRAYRQIKRS